MRSLHRLWDGNSTGLGRAMRSTFDAVAGFQAVKDTPDEPANGATYPGSDLGRALAGVARVIKGDVGVAVLTVDHGDWDHHTDIGTVEWGRMVQNAGDLAESPRGLPHRPRPLGRQGDGRDHQRVRPPGAGERQRRHSTTATAT